jgi:hypothetical protein
MPHKPSLRVGNVDWRSGQYQQTGSRRGRGNDVTVSRGEPLLRTPKLAMYYTLVDPTENKTGQGG